MTTTIPGLVRGICAATQDPMQLRRIKLTVPSLWGADITDWAYPCGRDSIPSVGTPVWVAFEMGDPNKPVWLGAISGGVGGGGGNGKTPTGQALQAAFSDHGYVAPTYDGTKPTLGVGTAANFLSWAEAQIGKPYVWGATGPDGFDCSGLVVYCATKAGLTNVPHYTVTQMQWCQASGPALTNEELVPGCLIYVPGSEGSLAAPGHVMIYYSPTQVIQAPYTGANVEYANLALAPGDQGISGCFKIPGLTY
jgi:hypothetical protein